MIQLAGTVISLSSLPRQLQQKQTVDNICTIQTKSVQETGLNKLNTLLCVFRN